MKPIKIFGTLLLLVLLLLTGCSVEKLAERGASMLDNMFAGERIKSTAAGTGTEPASDPEPEEPQPEEPQAEEPEISDPAKPVVPDFSGSQPPTGPVQSKPEEPEQSEPVQPDAAPDVTPSHTDVTFFSAGESFRYLPKGVSGIYACSYTSEDEKVAAVDPDTGRVTAVGPGTTNVKMHVEYNGQYDFTCVVRCSWKDDGKKDDGKTGTSSGKKQDKDDEPVLPPASKPAAKPETPASVDGISASHSDATFFNPKEHFRLLPIGAGDDCAVSYSTSNADVASVDGKTGTVTAVGPGTATVTMSVDCGGTEYSFECIVRCSW